MAGESTQREAKAKAEVAAKVGEKVGEEIRVQDEYERKRSEAKTMGWRWWMRGTLIGTEPNFKKAVRPVARFPDGKLTL